MEALNLIKRAHSGGIAMGGNLTERRINDHNFLFGLFATALAAGCSAPRFSQVGLIMKSHESGSLM